MKSRNKNENKFNVLAFFHISFILLTKYLIRKYARNK